MGCKCHPCATKCQFFAFPLNFLHLSYCCITLVAKEESPETMNELSRGLCEMLESSIVSYTHYPFDSDNMKHEKSSQILYHVIPPRQFCHP